MQIPNVFANFASEMNKSEKSSRKSFTGYLGGIIAAATFGLNPAFAVPMMREGMDVVSILFFRYLLSLPLMLCVLLIKKRYLLLPAPPIAVAMGAGLLMSLSSITLFESYKYLSVGVASGLIFIYPLFVAIIMVAFFREKMNSVTAIGIICAIFGVFMICFPGSGIVVSWFGVLIVSTSALCYALYIVAVNREPLRSADTFSLTFWVLLSGAFLTGACVAVNGHLDLPAQPSGWTNLWMLALLPTLLSLLTTNMAIDRIGPTPTAVLGVFEPVTAVLIGMVMFHEELTLVQWVGLALVLASVSAIMLRRELMSLLRMKRSKM